MSVAQESDLLVPCRRLIYCPAPFEELTMTKHLRSLMDRSPADTDAVIDLAAKVKANPGDYNKALDGKSIAMIFAKQSTRTRISFEVGIHQLGAQPLALSAGGGTGMQMGRGETIHDTAKVLSRFVHGIVIRTYGQDQVDGLAEHGVPNKQTKRQRKVERKQK